MARGAGQGIWGLGPNGLTLFSCTMSSEEKLPKAQAASQPQPHSWSPERSCPQLAGETAHPVRVGKAPVASTVDAAGAFPRQWPGAAQELAWLLCPLPQQCSSDPLSLACVFLWESHREIRPLLEKCPASVKVLLHTAACGRRDVLLMHQAPAPGMLQSPGAGHGASTRAHLWVAG